jgi:hypothetical protein
MFQYIRRIGTYLKLVIQLTAEEGQSLCPLLRDGIQAVRVVSKR